jgi:hypothetical protein
MLRRFAFILALLAPTGAALAGEFVAGTEDLPLMPGLAAVAGSSLMFDKPQGRIVEAQATGKVKRRDVQSFYRATLPELGWIPAGANAWRRDGEQLRLDFHGRDGSLTIGFSLSPL